MDMTTVQNQNMQQALIYDANKKSVGLAYALWFFFGLFGGHRFYAGKTGTAVIMLVISVLSFPLMALIIGFLTIAGVGVWVLIDAFSLAGWIREHNTRLAMKLTP
jgi:TM2 domain-containing membrane protein YozV